MASLLQSSYDYIVCGGGSAGCVVASRLSEDPNTSVLLLEAGISDLDYPASAIPNKTPTLRQSEVDWKYKVQYVNIYIYICMHETVIRLTMLTNYKY